MMSMMYIMVLIKDELCETIFVVPFLAELVPSFHQHFLYTLRKNVVTVQLLLSKIRMFLIILLHFQVDVLFQAQNLCEVLSFWYVKRGHHYCPLG